MKTDHNPWSFLTGSDPFLKLLVQYQTDGEFIADLSFEYHHEGAIGLPHGGLAMGLCLDLWRNFGAPKYPVKVVFRFGGSGLRIGDGAQMRASLTQDHRGRVFTASITKHGDRKPYLHAEVVSLHERVPGIANIEEPGEVTRLLPYYRNCFVCGHHRHVIGLQRRFRYHASPTWRGVTAVWGSDLDDRDRARYFLIGAQELHPAVITSIFDENTGWAGFMNVKGAGLTVRMELSLFRQVDSDDQLMFIGQPNGIRGSMANPRFFTADGLVLKITSNENPVLVARGFGEWIILHSITEQVKQNLLPKDDWQWIFE